MENKIYKILEEHKAILNKIDSEIIVEVDELKYQPIIYQLIKLGLNVEVIQLTQNVGIITFGLKQVFERNRLDIEKIMPKQKTKFKDAPIGARFKYPKQKEVWVKLNGFGDGLICEWKGNTDEFQNICSFVDEVKGISLETEIELI